MFGPLQEVEHAFAHCLRNLHARQLGALERHHLPAKLAHVTLVAGLVTPAAGRGMLSPDGILRSPLHIGAHPFVTGHGQGFAQCQKRHAVAVHTGVERAGPARLPSSAWL